jgi:SAM-dependent methyltransferase
MRRLAVTSREVIRHIIFVTGTYGAVTYLRERKGAGSSVHLREADLRSRFRVIYDAGIWRHGNDATPRSGLGSTLSATTMIREILPSLLDDLDAQTLLDVGCGDFFWMQHMHISQNYIGIDVVEALIETNKANFENQHRQFLSLDAINDELPNADVVMCREILFHLSFSDIRKLLRNILLKDRSYIIGTSDRQTGFNSDIPTGDFRLLNLEAWPLHFPAPRWVVDDSAVWPGRIIGVWDAEDLKKFIS